MIEVIKGGKGGCMIKFWDRECYIWRPRWEGMAGVRGYLHSCFPSSFWDKQACSLLRKSSTYWRAKAPRTQQYLAGI